MAAPPAAADLLTIRDAADRLAISRSALYVLIQRGEVETVRLGARTRRVVARSLQDLIERRRVDL